MTEAELQKEYDALKYECGCFCVGFFHYWSSWMKIFMLDRELESKISDSTKDLESIRTAASKAVEISDKIKAHRSEVEQKEKEAA